jgi:endonuclease YncB( thermonuclease family)
MGRIFLILLILAPPALAAETLRGPYDAVVTRVIDGDTFEARVHIWLLRQEVTTLVRIAGIDAPELIGDCPGLGRLSRDHLARLLEAGPVSSDFYSKRPVFRPRH